jgi:cardiolipin synthase
MSWTIPNLLSLLRIALVVPFLVALLHGEPRTALAIIVAAGISDALDGFIARFFHQQSRLGAYLDPVADKLLLTSGYVALALPGLHSGMRVPLWVTVLVLARDVLILAAALALYLVLGERRFPPSGISKLTTVFQVAGVILVLLSGLWPGLDLASRLVLYAAAALTVVSGLDYVVRTTLRLKRRA